MKHSALVTLLLVAIFLAAQFVGLATVNAYVNVQKTVETGTVVYNELPYNIERPQVAPGASFIYIITALLIGTAAALLLIKFRKITLWRLWFLLGVFLTLAIAFSAFINSTTALAAASILSLIKVFKPNVIVHNLTEIFIYGGLATIFVPMMNIKAAIILLIFISLYDMFAVWKSKHMVKLAEFQTDAKLFAGLLIPYRKGRPIIAKPAETAGKVKITTAVLGGGDMAFPLLFAGVAMKQFGMLKTLIIPVIAAFFLLLLLMKAEKKKFYPAMPFITAGCFIGYLLVQLV